jgi:4-amino-4-deoxy-L-arabinose transferase-like glycosyltransferase
MVRTKKLSPGFLLVWWGIMAAGAILMFTGITNESLWYDETYTGALVKQSLANIINITGGDNHPPLYYLILRIFTLIFGNTVFSLRVFSVLGALALAALGIGPVRRALGDRSGLIYTILTLTMPITVSMAQEARMYTWAAFLVAGSALYGFFSHLEGKTKDWILFAVFTVAAAYTHYYALLAVALVCAVVFAAMVIKRKNLVPFLYTAAAIILAYIPWLFKLLGAMNRVKGSYWIPPVTGEVIQRAFTYPFSNKFTVPLMPGLPAFGFTIAAIIISWGILSQMAKKDKNVFMAVMAMGTYLLTIITGIAASWLIRPVLVERYMIPVLGLFIMALSYGMAHLGKSITPAVIAGVLILVISGVQIQHTLSNRFNGPMRDAVQTLQVQPGDIFLHTDEHTFGTFSYYYPNNVNYYYVGQGNGGFSNFDAFQPNGILVRLLDELPKEQQVWLVYRPGGIDAMSVPSWIRSGQLKLEGDPVVFRLPFSWYSFMVYKARFPEAGSDKTLSGRWTRLP